MSSEHGVQGFTADCAARVLPVPACDANKYSRGCLLVVGGSSSFKGAPVLAALAAQRSGAGYVRLATVEAAAQTAQSCLLSATVAACPDTNGFMNKEALPQLEQLAAKAKAVAVGPGLGCSQATSELLWAMLESDALRGLPWLMDADALNIVAADVSRFKESRAGNPTVITPHEGEAARLLGRKVHDRPKDAAALASACGCVAVLKGPDTLVAFPDGELRVVRSGGPELAKAGTGDVLAGVVGALLAQGLLPMDAACLGVYLHGAAGAAAACEHSVLSMLPEDVIDGIAAAVRGLECANQELRLAQDSAAARALARVQGQG